MYPYLDSLRKEEKDALLPTTQISASATYAAELRKDPNRKSGESTAAAPGYFAGVKRDAYMAAILEMKDELFDLHTLWTLAWTSEYVL